MHAALPHTLGHIDLPKLETALLDALLDVRAGGRGDAIDRLLDDPALSAAGRLQVRQFLVAALTDTTPDRNRIVDNMLESAPVV